MAALAPTGCRGNHSDTAASPGARSGLHVALGETNSQPNLMQAAASWYNCAEMLPLYPLGPGRQLEVSLG